MVFSSVLFVYCFLPATLLFYYIAMRSRLSAKAGNIVLLFFSVLFYAWSGTDYCILLFAVATVNYFVVLTMEKAVNHKKIYLVFLLILDLGNLIYFKYASFLANSVSSVLGGDVERFKNLVLPIGISFYTFQIISYVIDVYRGAAAQHKYTDLLLYVFLFPQLIAGPIVRYTDIEKEIADRTIVVSDVEFGIKRFIWGFFKKVFIANSTGLMADTVFGVRDISMPFAWLGAICYAMQIYFDFSGYSDMAIGLGALFGFHFNENFNQPYISSSIKEFWRRWHISLSSWFRDYVYIPLGGNRKGSGRTLLNLLIVFCLTGIWHGAAWQFLFWGLFHGLFLIVERVGFGKVLSRCPKILSRIYTTIVVVIGWVFFRAKNLNAGFLFVKNMINFRIDLGNATTVLTKMTPLFWGSFFLAIAISFINPIEHTVLRTCRSTSLASRVVSLFCWILSLLYISGLSYNPFIYFQF